MTREEAPISDRGSTPEPDSPEQHSAGRPAAGSAAADQFSIVHSLENLLDVGERQIRQPTEFWRNAAGSQESVGEIISSFLLTAAAVPALARFLGSLLGHRGLVSSVVQLLACYAAVLASVAGITLALELLARKFGGRLERAAALKLTAYSCTPAYAGSLAFIVPNSTVQTIGAVAALYSFFLLQLGISVIVNLPEENLKRFTAYAFSLLFVWGLAVVQLIQQLP